MLKTVILFLRKASTSTLQFTAQLQGAPRPTLATFEILGQKQLASGDGHYRKENVDKLTSIP
jgi:hypothetical protein